MSKAGERLIAAAKEAVQIAKTRGNWVFPEYTELAPAVKRFFEIMDSREESDSGVEFSPVKMDYNDLRISSVRVYKSAELKALLPQMKKLALEVNTPINS